MVKRFMRICQCLTFSLLLFWGAQNRVPAQFELQPIGNEITNTLPTPVEEEYESRPSYSAPYNSSTSTLAMERDEEYSADENGLSNSGKAWEKLEGCRLMKDRYGDGDSFHVSHKGKEYIFRLYFADAPESNNEKMFRVKSQAKYFGVTEEQVIEWGHKATTYTWDFLQQQPFTIYTQWLDAKGSSALPRYFAVLITKESKNLSELLVEKGLARAYGAAADVPRLLKANEFHLRLSELQNKAIKKKIGIWAVSTKKD